MQNGRMRAHGSWTIAASALWIAAGCAAERGATPDRTRTLQGARAEGDPRAGEVSLPAERGWRGTLVVDQDGVGVWTAGVFKVFPQYACPEIVGLDDAGRLTVFWSYSGKWTPVSTVHDGKWLGGLVQADLDPRVQGTELYCGAQGGNLYQVNVHPPAYLDSRVIAQLAGREIHTLVGGQLVPSTPQPELLAFTNPGGMFLLRARDDGQDGFEVVRAFEQLGRIRDAVLLPTHEGEPPQVATVGRHGKLETLIFVDGEPQWATVHEAPMGMGRVALRPASSPAGVVLYTVSDDGRVWRHERDARRNWSSALIYVGAQGLRGCAAGRFDADLEVETLAIYGYSRDVELLSRRAGVWSAETIFTDRDKGHWIVAGEFDGRNSTDELVAAGYSGRIVLLARPPGYGLPGVLARTD